MVMSGDALQALESRKSLFCEKSVSLSVRESVSESVSMKNHPQREV